MATNKRDDGTTVPAEALKEFCHRCFVQLGLGPEDAAITADNFVFANLRGVDSHGVIRMKVYADRLRAGGIDPKAQPSVIEESPATALMDAHNGIGQVASVAAAKLAISKSHESGFGLVGVRNSNHFGAAAYYTMLALDEGMVGFAATNAGATMAPTGGREARLGNNPFAIAVPAQSNPPIILDMATGAVAWGKIFIAQQEGRTIPFGWALDRDGEPTQDPNAAADGGLIEPLGGYKGYGLSLLIDILTGVLCGSAFSKQVLMLRKNFDQPVGCAHTFGALRIESFMAVSEFRSRVDAIIGLMRDCPPAASVDRIYLPGEIEHEIEQRRRSQGIGLNAVLCEELATLASELGVPAPF